MTSMTQLTQQTSFKPFYIIMNAITKITITCQGAVSFCISAVTD